jgi:sugar phosphate isomerase/epimerase
MFSMKFKYSIFTKPFKNISAEELGEKVSGLGFNAIEFPLRDGYQVEPANAEKDLPKLVDTLGKYGVEISSIASSTSETIFAGCAVAGIKIIRIMASVDKAKRYLEWESNFIKYLDGLVPLCEKYGVTVGIQNHFGRMASGTMELRRLVEPFDAKYIAAIWDTAHSGLAGEEPEQALDIIWDKLCLINFKNAYYRQINGPEADQAEWKPYFTLGRYGAAHYPRIAAYIKQRGYKGDICLPAEYTNEDFAEKLVPIELEYVQSLLES